MLPKEEQDEASLGVSEFSWVHMRYRPLFLLQKRTCMTSPFFFFFIIFFVSVHISQSKEAAIYIP